MSSRNRKKSNSSRSSGAKTPSPTSQILEHVEMLVALHQNGSGESSGESLANSDNSELVDGIAQKLESQIAKRFDSLEDQIASSDSNHDSDGSNVDSSTLKTITERFDSLESKLTAIQDKAQGDGDGDAQFSATKIQERFEALDNRLEKVTAVIEAQQRLIENQNQKADSTDIDALQNQFSKMLSQMKQEMVSIVATEPSSDPPTQTEDDETASTSETSWNRQKQDMLSKYGIDPEHRPDMAPPTEPDPVLEVIMADQQLSASFELSPEESVSTTPEEIQRIKQELNSKLRDAEVELSLKRAKLSQLQAELESKQIDLDLRDIELTKKIGDQKSNSSGSFKEQVSILDRLKRHLTEKDRKNLDRI